MGRLLPWLGYIVGFLVLLIVVGYSAAQIYKPKILEVLNHELKNGINGDFKIGKLDFTFFEQFPNFSIALSDVYLRGPQYSLYSKDIFHAEKIYVHLQLLNLFRGAVDLKSIVVKNGSIFIFRTSGGYTNMEVIKKNKQDSVKNTDSYALSLDLGKILFENTHFTYVDSLKRKSFNVNFIKTNALIARSDSSRLISLDGQMWFGGLVFNEANGGYLSSIRTNTKLNLEFIPAHQRLILYPSELKFEKSIVKLSGHFYFTAPGVFELSIGSEEIDYVEALTLVTKALASKLSKYQFKGPMMVSLNVVGKLEPGDKPKVDIRFSSKRNRFESEIINVDSLSFKGTFTNHLDSAELVDDINSRITIDSLSGVIAGMSTEANFSISDLQTPQLKLDSRSRLNLIDLNDRTDTTRLKFLSGVLAADVSYTGKLKEYFDRTTTLYQGKLLGTINVTNASALMALQQKRFDKTNIQIRFTEKQMDLDKINFILNGSSIQVKGKVNGFIPFFFLPEKKGYVNLYLYSPRLDLATLVKKKSNAPLKTAKKGRKMISDLIDDLNEKVEFNLELKADEIVKGSFHASELSGKVSLIKNQFSADPIKMKMAGGAILLSLKMADLDKPINQVNLSAAVKDADIKKFFNSFDNFAQSTIRSENLSGKVSANVKLTALVDDQFNILTSSMAGDVDFKIKEGKLQDFEPLQKMSNFLLKKRDFTEVEFAEINSRFQLSGRSLNIDRMEIQSSVLTLFLQGRYSLADSTDLSIQVPLSNLKRRDKTYKPENVGVDAKVGPSVFLRAYKNKEGKVVIAYDPFKKFKKKK